MEEEYHVSAFDVKENPVTFPDPIHGDENSNNVVIGKEEYLDTLDRKVNEIMNRDCSRRSKI